MHMVPDKFPSLDYKQLLTDVTESESEVSTNIYHRYHHQLTLLSLIYVTCDLSQTINVLINPLPH